MAKCLLVLLLKFFIERLNIPNGFLCGIGSDAFPFIWITARMWKAQGPKRGAKQHTYVTNHMNSVRFTYWDKNEIRLAQNYFIS